MGQTEVEKNVGGIEGLWVIISVVHGNSCGYFMETYKERVAWSFVQTVRYMAYGMM